MKGQKLTAQEVLNSLVPRDIEDHLLSIFDDFEKAVHFFRPGHDDGTMEKMGLLRAIFSKSIVSYSASGDIHIDKMSWDNFHAVFFPERD